jgi:hypothetical protein
VKVSVDRSSVLKTQASADRFVHEKGEIRNGDRSKLARAMERDDRTNAPKVRKSADHSDPAKVGMQNGDHTNAPKVGMRNGDRSNAPKAPAIANRSGRVRLMENVVHSDLVKEETVVQNASQRVGRTVIRLDHHVEFKRVIVRHRLDPGQADRETDRVRDHRASQDENYWRTLARTKN